MTVNCVEKASAPKNGDTIRYQDKPAYLAMTGSRMRIFDVSERKYVELDKRRIVPDPQRPGQWIYDESKKLKPLPNAQMQKYEGIVNIQGQVTHLTVDAESEGKAKNKILGLLATKLGQTIRGVNAIMSRSPNSLKVSEVRN